MAAFCIGQLAFDKLEACLRLGCGAADVLAQISLRDGMQPSPRQSRGGRCPVKGQRVEDTGLDQPPPFKRRLQGPARLPSNTDDSGRLVDRVCRI